MSVQYLSEKSIIEINKRLLLISNEGKQIIQYPEGLSLVINQPKLTLFGNEMYPTIWLKAAYILQKITKKHIFNNGNKRTAFVATKMFLLLNDWHLQVTTHQGLQLMLNATTAVDNTDEMKKIATFLQNHSQKINK